MIKPSNFTFENWYLNNIGPLPTDEESQEQFDQVKNVFYDAYAAGWEDCNKANFSN